MKIGKNIHTENKKKDYRKPVMEVVAMDREMRLIMMTPPDDPQLGTSSNLDSNPIDKPTYQEKQQYQKSNNPFGGGSPDFER